MKRHRIAHLLPFPNVGGTEVATLRIAKAVAGEGFESVAFCRDDAQPVAQYFEAEGVETARWRPVEPSYTKPLAFVGASRMLARELRERRIDMVHCADYLAAHYGCLGTWLARVPVLCHVRGRFPAFSRRDATFMKAVDRFAFVSRQTWRDFGYRVPENRGTVVYDGVEVGEKRSEEERASAAAALRAELRLSAGTPLVVMAARVAPPKDYETLIKAAVQVVQAVPGVRFVVAGNHNAEDYERVKSWLAQWRVSDAFLFTGFRRDVRRLMAAADVSVLSTHHEGLPLVILEAMAEGTPVIATAVGGIPEVIEDGRTGLLAPDGDDRVLAEHICRVLTDPGRSARMTAAARAMVEQRFSPERFQRDMLRLYSATLGK